jgi:aspartyl-tRNA(Asn)/glutamyl-tRNA(Gln) amidotransferase subunit A
MADTIGIAEAAEALRAGTVSSVELTRRALARADADDETLGVFVSRFSESALDAAAHADQEFSNGVDRGTLQGIPVAIKDIIATTDGPTTAQSIVHDSRRYIGDAPVVQRLRSRGAVIVGKTTTMEYACGLPDPNGQFPLPLNPWDSEHWAGGSSSGSASGVASRMVFGALGTDSAGSIRIPAAFCGITGLMPTYGRVPRTGVVPLGYSADHVGPMARDANGCAHLLRVIAGHHPQDNTSSVSPVPNYVDDLTGDLTGIRIGVDRLDRVGGDLADRNLDTSFDAALAALEDAGAHLVEVELPNYREMMAANMVFMMGEALSHHAPRLRERWSDFGPGTRAMLAPALAFTASDYVTAQRARRLTQLQVAALHREVRLIATPTIARTAHRIDDVHALLGERGFDPIYTQYWDCMGLPTVSLPMPAGADGLPLGLQLSGHAFAEGLVLRAADAVQRRSTWHLQSPTALTPQRETEPVHSR